MDSHCVDALSGSDLGNMVPAFNGAGAWNQTDVCPPPGTMHSITICEGCNRGMADCDTGTL